VRVRGREKGEVEKKQEVERKEEQIEEIR